MERSWVKVFQNDSMTALISRSSLLRWQRRSFQAQPLARRRRHAKERKQKRRKQLASYLILYIIGPLLCPECPWTWNCCLLTRPCTARVIEARHGSYIEVSHCSHKHKACLLLVSVSGCRNADLQVGAPRFVTMRVTTPQAKRKIWNTSTWNNASCQHPLSQAEHNIQCKSKEKLWIQSIKRIPLCFLKRNDFCNILSSNHVW